MREIIRPDLLWRDVIPLAAFAGVVLLLFLIALLLSAENLADTDVAVSWTMRLVGALVAVVATFGLFWRALNGEALELQFGFVLALLAGLLLVGVHWSLAIALGLIGVALILREIWSAYFGGPRAADVAARSTTSPPERPLT